MSNSTLFKWLDSRLTDILGFPSTSEITQYVLSMDNLNEQEQYLKEILNSSDPNHLDLIREFKSRSLGSHVPKGQVKVYKKSAINDEEEYLNYSGKAKKGKGKENLESNQRKETQTKKQKTKYVSIHSKDGQAKDVVLLSGRHYCSCEASKHKLINNCIKCGKIVCEQEGSGPCLFCGNLVCTKEEQEVLDRGSKKSDILMKKLIGDKVRDHLESSLTKAEKHKNTLLEYDATCEKRTQVIDDESDYFSLDSNRWLSKKQKEDLAKREAEIREARHGSRLDRKITFDFAGRRVVEDDSASKTYDPSKDQKLAEIMKEDPFSNTMFKPPTGDAKADQSNSDIVNPDISVPRPQFDNSVSTASSSKTSKRDSAKTEKNSKYHLTMRIQDPNLQEMRDNGNTLSMHQPYASLLVCGIKRDEGRTWYSPVRGRLWIHAASKVPSDQEIKEVLDFYRIYYQDDHLPFPSSFPTGCLLGCVDVSDCLAQEEYREQYPDGESSSPYVFVCSNPQELTVKFPMVGQHKIYKLDPAIHQAAQKCAKRSPK